MRIRGTGPKPASIMLIGEAPGREEDQCGLPFVGKSGRELTKILERAGLDRRQMYVTNICKVRPPVVNGKQQPPSKEEIERDESELLEELLQVRPRWIGAIGRVATRWLTDGDMDMEAAWGLAFPLGARAGEGIIRRLAVVGRDEVSDVQSSLREMDHDALQEVQGSEAHWTGRCTVVPLYHPAAGMHNADLAQFVWRGIEIFGGYVNGSLSAVTPTDSFPTPDYREGLQDYAGLSDGPIACDTEGIRGAVWGGSVSHTPGTARVIRVRNSHDLGETLARAPVTVFHNLLHDAEILREAGIELDWGKCEDTFLMAYCLRLVPQGLKQLSRRFCGMSMQSYLDVVAPAERKIAYEWVERALAANECPLCDGTGKVPEARKDGKGYKKQRVRCTYEGEDGRRCIDGGMWVERQETLKYDWDTGEWKLSKGWSTARYLNGLRKDMQVGKYDEEDEDGNVRSVRDRVGHWPEDVLGMCEEAIGDLREPTLDDIDSAAATYYSARDADATLRVYPILREQIDTLDLRDAYRLDLSVIPIAAEMQRNGMYVSKPYFEDLSNELTREKDIILARLQHYVGRPINPSSGDQVAALLFGEKKLSWSHDDQRQFSVAGWELEAEKTTKSGSRAAVDDKVLEALKLKHSSNTELVKLLNLITDYRVCDKMEGTYARKIPRLADAYDRIHTTIKPCRTATFRWSSADPNLQNIPTKKKRDDGPDYGKRIRSGFVAPPGFVLGSWDFDQIEMRVLAWYSQDENLLRVFREGLDIHSLTAALVWRIPFDSFMAELKGSDVVLAMKRKEQRASAKNIGFGVVYGVTAKGLRAQMELRGQYWTEEQCQELIDMYLQQAYPGVGRWMMDAHAEARRDGYVRSLYGHIRYVPGVHSSISSVREEALRQAANFKIQCTAAELLKVSMRALWTDYKSVLDEVGSRILMAVHDELLLEVPDNAEARAITDAVVTAAMTDPYLLDGVSVGTTGKYEYNWGLLK